ncbi:hypothetical protein GCM10009755_01790 [Brevibacterium samyangense]|uniref:Secreted peptide n=1 Tax=Brevibacterium samyangense TaxID=366888 RepID=A0ABN2T3V9_9MICO
MPRVLAVVSMRVMVVPGVIAGARGGKFIEGGVPVSLRHRLSVAVRVEVIVMVMVVGVICRLGLMVVVL